MLGMYGFRSRRSLFTSRYYLATELEELLKSTRTAVMLSCWRALSRTPDSPNIKPEQ